MENRRKLGGRGKAGKRTLAIGTNHHESVTHNPCESVMRVKFAEILMPNCLVVRLPLDVRPLIGTNGPRNVVVCRALRAWWRLARLTREMQRNEYICRTCVDHAEHTREKRVRRERWAHMRRPLHETMHQGWPWSRGQQASLASWNDGFDSRE